MSTSANLALTGEKAAHRLANDTQDLAIANKESCSPTQGPDLLYAEAHAFSHPR